MIFYFCKSLQPWKNNLSAKDTIAFKTIHIFFVDWNTIQMWRRFNLSHSCQLYSFLFVKYIKFVLFLEDWEVFIYLYYAWLLFSKSTIAFHVNDILTERTFKYIPFLILIKLRKGTYLSYYLTILLRFEQHPLKAFFYHTKMKLNMFQRQMFSFCFIYYRCLKYTWALFCSR